MRVLMVVKDGEKSSSLSKVFKKDGYVVDDFGGCGVSEEDVCGDIKHSGNTSYGLVIHDSSVPLRSVVGVPARLLVVGNEGKRGKNKLSLTSEHANNCSLRVISSRDRANDILRKAALEISNVYALSSQGIIKAGAFEINLLKRTVKIDGKELVCTKGDFNILRILAVHAGRPLTAKQIVEHLYDANSETEDPIGSFHVCLFKLNKKIEKLAGEEFKTQFLGRYLGYVIADRSAFGSAKQIKFGSVSFDTATHKLSRRGNVVYLKKVEGELLKILADNELKSDNRLMSFVEVKSKGSLKVHVSNLRVKIASVSGENYIKNTLEQGYQLLDAPVQGIKSVPFRKHKL